jgi:hypothetical protein
MRKIFFVITMLISAVWVSAQVNPITAYNNSYGKEKKTKTRSGTGGHIEMTPFVGYQLNGRIDFYEGDFKMDNAMSYGGMLSVQVGPGVFGEFSYSRSDTKGTYRPYLGIDSYEYDMAINYFQLGGIKTLGQGPVKPFGLFSGGATWFKMKDDYVDDEVVFSVALGGGLKVDLSDRIGLRLQGRMLMPLYIHGGGFFFGIGPGGPSSGISFNSTLLTLQGDFTGALVIKLGR